MSAICRPNSASSSVAGKASKSKKIGILALQGDVSLHARALQTAGMQAILVKRPAELKGLDGLVIPGGESTALLRLAEPVGLLRAITAYARAGGNIFGTCAGAIILASSVTNPVQPSLGLLDITLERNGYGRQLDSTEATGQGHSPLNNREIPLTFIRAPRITATGKTVEILASYRDEPVLVRQANIMAATFHPELDADMTVYTYWLGQV
jgi:5'-phosphate synthase pdxT subunit